MWSRQWRLELGSKGPQVAGLVECLQVLGFEPGGPGELGEETLEAYWAWQESRGRVRTMAVDPESYQALWQERDPAFALGTAKSYPESTQAAVSLVVSLEARLLFLYQHQRHMRTYPVSIGKARTPTPEGEFRILELWEAQGFSLGRFYFSFTPYRHSLHSLPPGGKAGEANTLGCLQLKEEDLAKLSGFMRVGTSLVIAKEHQAAKESGEWLFYYPEKEEELSQVCLRYGVGLSELLAFNGITRQELEVGQRLRIPLQEE